MKLAIVCVAAAAEMYLLAGVAKAEPPPCSEPGIIENLQDDVRAKIRSAVSPIGNVFIDKIAAIQVPHGNFDVRVTEMFTVSHSDDTRECQANLHLIESGRTDGTTPIVYRTVRTEDGKNIYSIRGEQTIPRQLFDSLDANNDLTPSIQEVGRELLRSANENSGIKQLMQSNPGLNRPAPRYPPSHF